MMYFVNVLKEVLYQTAVRELCYHSCQNNGDLGLLKDLGPVS